MGELLMYLLLAVFGYILAYKVIKQSLDSQISGGIQTVAILILVFSMGARMGANDEVIRNLNKIGLFALFLTVTVLLFSVISVSVFRRVIGLDREGRTKKERTIFGEKEKKEGSETSHLHIKKNSGKPDDSDKKTDGGIMTFLIVLTAGFGMFFGYGLIHYDLAQYEVFDLLTGYVIKAGLCILVFMVGLELGDEGTFLTDVRAAGAKVLMVPVATALGTLAGAAVSTLFLPFSLKQVLAIGAGFGWYSFAPVMIMEKGFVLVSAVSFMHNVMRELLSMLLIPIVAKNLGFIEAVALPGSSSSDICLPLIVKSTRGGIAVYSFMNGISVSIFVPILVPLCIG